MSYSTAITRIPVTGHGVFVATASKEQPLTFTGGDVTLNIVNGRLNSVTVKRGKQKAVNIKSERVLGLDVFASHRDTLIFLSYKR
jgi:hypothetical protein